MVVEDEEAMRRVVTRSLEASGYKVLAAATGDEALRMSEQHPGEIHLLLTDVVMPRMSGRLLAQELAKARPTVVVLYMSGYADNSFVRNGEIEEGTHFIGKPFTVSDHAHKVREVLDR